MEAGEIPNKEKPNALIEKVKGLNLLLRTSVIGRENLSALPQGKNVIVVTTHTGNYDVPIVINALRDYFKNPTVAEESTHYHFRQDPANYIGHFFGAKNSFRVDYDSGDKKRRGKFDPDNLEPMRKSLEEGRPLFIAAHYDPSYRNEKNELPEQAGNGAAYLAQIVNDAIILPVAVDVKLDKPLREATDILKLSVLRLTKGRTNVDVVIGKPFSPEHIDGIEQLGEILKKRKSGSEISKEELSKFSELKLKLKAQSKVIMQRLAELLPLQKRGIWNKEQVSSEIK